MNWEEAAITTVILGFGPLKLADRICLAAQERRNALRERRARIVLERARARLVEVQTRLGGDRLRPSRLALIPYPDCPCGHSQAEHYTQTRDRRCRMWLTIGGHRMHCTCPGYKPAAGYSDWGYPR